MERADASVDLERVMLRECTHVSCGVRDESDLQPCSAQLLEHRDRILVQLEVLVALPSAGELEGDVVGYRLGAALPDDDPLRERNPLLLVVLERLRPFQTDEPA